MEFTSLVLADYGLEVGLAYTAELGVNTTGGLETGAAYMGNLDLTITLARIEEARGLRRIARADQVPTIDANASAQRQKLSESGLIGQQFSDTFNFRGDVRGTVQHGPRRNSNELYGVLFF